MKTLVAIFVIGIVFFSCGKKTGETATVHDILVLPMEVTYKGTPGLGNPKNVQTVMEWNKRLSELNMDLGDLLADTVTWHLQDGVEMTAPRDSAIVAIKSYLADMTNVKIVYTAAVPIDNKDRNDEWVFSWTDETYTHKDGKVEHNFIHEDYRLVAGKIREVFQYLRKDAPAKPMVK